MDIYYKIGLTLPGTLLTSLVPKIPRPKSPLQYYADYHTSASGLVTGLGDPIIEWRWGFLTRAQRDKLRTFCPSPAASAMVYIRTPTNDAADTWGTYYCVMNWPQTDDREATRRINFSIKFTMCKLQYLTEP